MSYGDLYKRVGQNYNVGTANYRFSVIAAVCGVPLPDPDSIRKIDDKTYKTIIGSEMTEQKERTLFLFGADALDDQLFTELIHSKDDMSEILADAEEYLVSQSRYIESEQITKERFNNILRCCINSISYRKSGRLTFADALAASELSRADISSGVIKITDWEMMTYLIEQGADFGWFEENGEYSAVNTVAELELLRSSVDDFTPSSNKYPFMLDPSKAVVFDKFFDKDFGKEYIRYCREHGFSLTESGYRSYVDDVQCTYRIKCYHRKRRICGERINFIDYIADMKNNVFTPDSEDTVKLTELYDADQNVLLRYALTAFKNKYPIQKDTVFEVNHLQKNTRYVYTGSDYLPLDEGYNEMLFDFNTMYSKLQESVKDDPVYAVNGKLQIPQALLDSFEEGEKEYIVNIIREQYAHQLSSKIHSPVLSNLASLKASAKVAMQQEEESKKQAAEERERKKAEREQRRNKSGVNTFASAEKPINSESEN